MPVVITRHTGLSRGLNMSKRKILIACKIFEDELQALLQPDRQPEIIWIDASLHADEARLEEELKKAMNRAEAEPGDIKILFGRACHIDMPRLARECGAESLSAANCIEALCGEKKDDLERERTMLMTPGWIRSWPGMMKALGWSEVDFRLNLGRYDRIRVLDAGISPLTEEEILEFFDLVQIPIEIDELSLESFEQTIRTLLGNEGGRSGKDP
jgi:hypothetical protein